MKDTTTEMPQPSACCEQEACLTSQAGSKSPVKSSTFVTPKGNLHIQLRRSPVQSASSMTEATVLHHPPQKRSFTAIYASFAKRHHMTGLSEFIQLHVFLPYDFDRWDHDYELMSTGTLPEIDAALRCGSISPYQLHHSVRSVYPLIIISKSSNSKFLGYY